MIFIDLLLFKPKMKSISAFFRTNIKKSKNLVKHVKMEEKIGNFPI